jgi:4-carboxymuconolactone decarboxylase
VLRRFSTDGHGRDRSTAILTALTAQGVSADRLSAHLQLAGQHGLDLEAPTALMTLMAVCTGYARASLAMETTVHGLFDSHAPNRISEPRRVDNS